jgi:hypothetical protein
MAACVGVLALTTGKVQAQGRGNFDPAQFRQRMVDRYKDRMGVTNDDEWTVISAAIGKVVDAQMDANAGTMRGMFGGGRNRNRGGDTNNVDPNAAQPQQRRGPQPSPEAEALQKAIDDKVPADEIKAKLAALRDANAAKDAKLTSAQEDLKKLLTSRQEAVAVLYGLLK